MMIHQTTIIQPQIYTNQGDINEATTCSECGEFHYTTESTCPHCGIMQHDGTASVFSNKKRFGPTTAVGAALTGCGDKTEDTSTDAFLNLLLSQQ